MKTTRLFLWLAYILIFYFKSEAQAPFQISPKWMFGYKAGISFSPSPSLLSGNPSTSAVAPALETSTSICDTAGNLVFYTDAVRIYNGFTNAVVRDMSATDGVAANSATDGAVAIPDPASPTTSYYLFIANDLTAGLHPSKGINYYKLSVSGTTVSVTSGPTVLAGTAAGVDESLGAGSDGTGGYWIVSHEVSNNNFWVWHVTSSGVSSVSKQTHSPYVGGTGNGTVKISTCQNKIAWTGNNSLVVYPWNMTTGTITNSAIYSNVLGMGATGTEPTYGLEFSPDGSKVYHTVLGNGNTTNGVLKQVDLSTSTLTTIASGSANGGSKELGTMQLAPDGKIYVTNGAISTTGAIYVGVINSPNTSGTSCSYVGAGFQLKPSNTSTDPSTYRGIVNEAWLGPQTPALDTSSASSCSEKIHAIDFKTYFNDQISVDNTTVQWSFDNGSTWTTAGSKDINNSINPYTYDYGGSVSTTAKVKFKDLTCQNSYQASISVNVNCPAPVKLSTLNASEKDGTVIINWSTASEINNEYFIIERSSDGLNFNTIGQVKGNGTTSIPLQYSFVDIHPLTGLVFYRVVQYDFNGNSEASKFVYVSREEGNIIVYPNPTASTFNTKISGTSNGFVIVKDITGKEVYRVVVKASDVQFSFGESLPPGPYILQLISESEIKTLKIEKK